jgi:hypothetical protein
MGNKDGQLTVLKQKVKKINRIYQSSWKILRKFEKDM